MWLEAGEEQPDGRLIECLDRIEAAVGREEERGLADLREMRNEVRAEMRELAKEDTSDDPLAAMIGKMTLVPMLCGVRFGITMCILAIKSRRKHPDGELPVFDRMSRRMRKKAGGAE